MIPNAPHDRSMLSKLRKVWTAAKLNSEWATNRMLDLDGEVDEEVTGPTEPSPAEARYESIQARMESVQKCCELAAEAIERRNNGYGEESVWLDELDMGPRIRGYAEGLRFWDIKTGLSFTTIDELNDYLRQVEPELFTDDESTELEKQRLAQEAQDKVIHDLERARVLERLANHAAQLEQGDSPAKLEALAAIHALRGLSNGTQ